MKVYTIDLYEYFKVEKPQDARGFLTCYLVEQIASACKNRKHPAMLVIPGGGYYDVSKREGEVVALKFLANNYNAFVLNYSCKPVRFPYAFMEAAMAMAYIRENADELFVNNDCVGAIGFSAGGHLLGCISTMYDRKELDFLKEKKSFVRPDASLFLYPVITGIDKPHLGSFQNLFGEDYLNKVEEFSIEKNVTPNSPPAFIVSTYNDGGVPCKNSLLLACAYENNGVPFSLHIFEKGGHGLSTCEASTFTKEGWKMIQETSSASFKTWVEMSLNWLKERGFDTLDN